MTKAKNRKTINVSRSDMSNKVAEHWGIEGKLKDDAQLEAEIKREFYEN